MRSTFEWAKASEAGARVTSPRRSYHASPVGSPYSETMGGVAVIVLNVNVGRCRQTVFT